MLALCLSHFMRSRNHFSRQSSHLCTIVSSMWLTLMHFSQVWFMLPHTPRICIPRFQFSSAKLLVLLTVVRFSIFYGHLSFFIPLLLLSAPLEHLSIHSMLHRLGRFQSLPMQTGAPRSGIAPNHTGQISRTPFS